MFIAKKQFSSNQGTFRRGDEVPAEIAARYSRNVEEVGGKPAKAKAEPKVEEVVVQEEILTEDSASVEVEAEEE